MNVARETAAAMEGVFDLLYRLTSEIPDLNVALRQGARVTFDAAENAIIVGARLDDGTSRPLLAIRCDPADRESFGEVGAPLAMPTDSVTYH